MNGDSSYSRFISGDKDAFAELVIRYNKSLIFYLYGIVKNIDTAEDIAADTFAEIFVKKPHLKTEDAFHAYLFKAGRNNALDFLRKFLRKSRAEERLRAEYSAEGELEAELIRDERKRALHSALGELKDDYRDALHLIYFEEMSYEQAGKAMNKSVKQITNLVYRAKESLRRILEGRGISYED